jgi:flagellar biosynthesis protein FlhA
LKVITLDTVIEDELSRSIETSAPGGRSALPGVPLMRRVLDSLQKLVGDQAAIASTILPCSCPAYFDLRPLIKPFPPRVVVLSPTEIPPGISVQYLGVVR